MARIWMAVILEAAKAGRPPVRASLLALFLLSGNAPAADSEAEPSRPYEMEWAGRNEDTRPPTVDFESLDGWNVDSRQAVAAFGASRQQLLWGQQTARLVYRGDGGQPSIIVRPAEPVALPEAWDCVNLWVYGNNWAWSPDRTTPPVELALLFRPADGESVRVPLGAVRWKEWSLVHRRLPPEQLATLRGAAWEGLEISGGRNTEDRELYFDNLCFYRDPLGPLAFEPRPLRGVDPLPGQQTGTNTGPGRLPFPNRTETLLPDNLTADFRVTLEQRDGGYDFVYEGDDGRLTYRFRPENGDWSDIRANWQHGDRSVQFQPLAGGGVRFAAADGKATVAPEATELIECVQQGETVVARWRCRGDEGEAEISYTLRLWQKSLVIDVACAGGAAAAVDFGKAVGAEDPRLVTLPYLTGAAQRPAVLVTGTPDQPLFVMGLVDHTRSNASELYFINDVGESGVQFNGGARYMARTDGRRNDCAERFFLSVSPRFEEVLPNVPNPPSPWMQVTGQRLWRAHAATQRERDLTFWRRIARYGMTQMVVTDHETGWRDGGESFTFRTRAAPGKGGDAGQAQYARDMRALGFRYGIYNNYTDFAPVNGHWDEDLVTRQPDGNWRGAWPRCYNPKPARAVEYEARLAPIIQEKFQLDTAYCDVHTAVQPWQYVDYDARVPGAGTFAATFYAYGEIMLHQKQCWNGPVYSEGNNHWYYCGLTDGNYGQDQAARLDENSWLVDFDLRKLHGLCCNFGMGNLNMFFGRQRPAADSSDPQRALSQFLAATLAFGHTGFLVTEGGTDQMLRSYFGLQAIHARYAQAAPAEIRYAAADGQLLDSTAAVAGGAYRRSQVFTRYDNGVELWVNGHPGECWETPHARLGPFGWYARDGASLTAYSALVEGRRTEYVECDAYRYADPAGRFLHLPTLSCDGPLVVHLHPQGVQEVIPVAPCTQFGVSLDGRGADAVALDEAGQPMSPVPTRFSRGLVYVQPLDGAFSYRLTPTAPPAVTLHCPRREVVPGERVRVEGREVCDLEIPADAMPGEQLWRQLDQAWIDFLVRPLADAELNLEEAFRLELISHAAAAAQTEVRFDGQHRSIELVPGEPATIEFPFTLPDRELVRELPLNIVSGPLQTKRTWWLKCEETIRELAQLKAETSSGQRLRGGEDAALDAASGVQLQWAEMACGGETAHGMFMHPPYRGGVGSVFAVFGPLDLPASFPAAFSCRIGKRDGSDSGDGILFRVSVIDDAGEVTVVAEQQWIEHVWRWLEARLDRWAGKRVYLRLEADVGPRDNSSGDWACWTAMRLQSAQPVLTASLHSSPVSLQHIDGPRGPAEQNVEQLRGASAGWLHFQGIGLQASGQYVSSAQLNGIPLGPLPAAGGVEAEDRWAEARLALPAAAIAGLQRDNLLVIENPGQDCFKIGRCWLELELPDGQRCSSQIQTAVHTQPPEWPPGEGTRVPFGQNIRIPLRFRPAR